MIPQINLQIPPNRLSSPHDFGMRVSPSPAQSPWPAAAPTRPIPGDLSVGRQTFQNLNHERSAIL
ncbi:MAG TPA: hypothetical protein PLC06_02390, partial [Promineifilum sp.]|nr:hypothetical protein [Promineifilum sp.]